MKQIATSELVGEINDAIQNASVNYHRLVIVAGPPGCGKTTALRELGGATGLSVLNVNKFLSRELLDMTKRQRAIRVPKLLSELVSSSDSDVVLLDNIELLFDVELKQDPLRLLQGLSRNKTLVCAWSGTAADGQLAYAVPDHQEYRRYPIRDFLVVTSEKSA